MNVTALSSFDVFTIFAVLLPSFLAIITDSEGTWPQYITDLMSLVLVFWIIMFVSSWPLQFLHNLDLRKSSAHPQLIPLLNRYTHLAWAFGCVGIALGAFVMFWARSNIILCPQNQPLVFSNTSIGLFVVWNFIKLVHLYLSRLESHMDVITKPSFLHSPRHPYKHNHDHINDPFHPLHEAPKVHQKKPALTANFQNQISDSSPDSLPNESPSSTGPPPPFSRSTNSMQLTRKRAASSNSAIKKSPKLPKEIPLSKPKLITSTPPLRHAFSFRPKNTPPSSSTASPNPQGKFYMQTHQRHSRPLSRKISPRKLSRHFADSSVPQASEMYLGYYVNDSLEFFRRIQQLNKLKNTELTPIPQYFSLNNDMCSHIRIKIYDKVWAFISRIRQFECSLSEIFMLLFRILIKRPLQLEAQLLLLLVKLPYITVRVSISMGTLIPRICANVFLIAPVRLIIDYFRQPLESRENFFTFRNRRQLPLRDEPLGVKILRKALQYMDRDIPDSLQPPHSAVRLNSERR